MSGHSHWAGIKHKKALVDAKKGKSFSQLSRLITVAAKEKGGDPETNSRLRLAISKAREANMPKDNIERAIKKGTGELAGETLEEFLYEAYGPSGSALIIEGITDNKNRTIANIRNILTKFNGKLADIGSVKYMFERQADKWVTKYPLEIQDRKTQEQISKLIGTLEEDDDVQEVYSNVKSL